MSNKIKVSIITVCFNAERTIEKTLRSACSQTHPHIEYIIVDGASSDKTLEIVNKYSSKISKIISEKDKGIYDAMNKGVAAATGDLVYFLNADDRFHDNEVVADIANIFAQDSSRTFVYGDVIFEGAPQGLNPQLARELKKRTISEFLYNSFCHQAIFVRRDLFSKIGLFNTKYKYAADYAWVVKAFKFNSAGFFYVNRKITYYFYMGRSYHQSKITRREGREALFQYLFSFELLWFLFRYHLLRNLKKSFLKEKY